MDLKPKTPRRRVANFTADEKALLAQLVRKRPVVKSKVTDGKTVINKKTAWDIITQEFNCHANIHKRDTVTLKRAWDRMKAFTRKMKEKNSRKTSYYIRREAVLRIKHLENRKRMEMQIWKSKLRAAALDEERRQILLRAAALDEERSRIQLSIIELQKEKKSLQ